MISARVSSTDFLFSFLFLVCRNSFLLQLVACLVFHLSRFLFLLMHLLLLPHINCRRNEATVAMRNNHKQWNMKRLLYVHIHHTDTYIEPTFGLPPNELKRERAQKQTLSALRKTFSVLNRQLDNLSDFCC